MDDLEVFLTAKEPCTVTTLQRLQNAGCRVLATLRISEYDRFQPVGELRPPQLDVLQSMTLIRLDDEQDEQDRIAAQISDPQIAAGIRRYGLAEYVGGGYLGIERFKNGKAVHPLGVAVLRATSDWHRLGFDVIPEIILAALASAYLGTKDRDDPGESYQQALDWAKGTIGGRIRLLEPTESGWRLFDYLRDHLTGLDELIPQQTWAEALAAVTGDPRRALTLGYRAYQRELPDLAIQSWRISSASLSDPSTPITDSYDSAAVAAANLGGLLARQGDSVGAAAAYQQAIDSGHADAAPGAAEGMGDLLAGQGDPAGAAAAYQLAIDSGHSNWAPSAAVFLGRLLAKEGDPAGAAAAYQHAIDSGHSNWAPTAAVFLGDLLAGKGDPAGAAAAYQHAIDSGHSNWAPPAAVGLGDLLAGKGDPAGAAAAYQQAIDSGHAEAAKKAALSLRGLRFP